MNSRNCRARQALIWCLGCYGNLHDQNLFFTFLCDTSPPTEKNPVKPMIRQNKIVSSITVAKMSVRPLRYLEQTNVSACPNRKERKTLTDDEKPTEKPYQSMLA